MFSDFNLNGFFNICDIDGIEHVNIRYVITTLWGRLFVPNLKKQWHWTYPFIIDHGTVPPALLIFVPAKADRRLIINFDQKYTQKCFVGSYK